jgi:hypothetical protein
MPMLVALVGARDPREKSLQRRLTLMPAIKLLLICGHSGERFCENMQSLPFSSVEGRKSEGSFPGEQYTEITLGNQLHVSGNVLRASYRPVSAPKPVIALKVERRQARKHPLERLCIADEIQIGRNYSGIARRYIRCSVSPVTYPACKEGLERNMSMQTSTSCSESLSSDMLSGTSNHW